MKIKIKKIIFSLLLAGAATFLMGKGILYRPDNTASDLLYQHPRATNGDVVIIGIDDRSLEELGPFQNWSRDAIAEVIQKLNQDEKRRPAAIGVDVLYTGESENQEADEKLVKAVQEGNNVVLACMAEFASDLVVDKTGTFYMDDYSIQSFAEPFEALKINADMGHINGMYDTDGVLRHSIYSVELPDGRKIPSFNYQIYKKFAKYHNTTISKNLPLDARKRWYVPYANMPGSYDEGISIVDVLNDEIPVEMFEGKIVLIGPYASGLSDYFVTSMEHAQLMYGVEFQANCIDALIAGDFKKEVSTSFQLIILFVIVLFFTLFSMDRKVMPLTLVWVVFTFGYVILAKIGYANGYVLHVLWIPVCVTCIYIASVAINYVQARMEKHKITNTFKKYVAPEIVNEILKKGQDELDLEGKMTDIAVLFVDIRGFTPMSELLSPREVVDILNKYLTLTSSCIIKNKGTLDKFIGDATMAFWGAPLKQEDYIFNAVKAAMDMVEASEALSKELLEQYGRTVSFGIGVHCGPAVVGNIGAKNRMDYTAIGDTVNTSSRLESNAPANTIYISRAVADALKGRIEVTSLGNGIKLKGKKEGFEILKVDKIIENKEEEENKKGLVK
ncbi:MAG: adenylate/guanylate cyclase domain-containing protein [Acetivibrio sp.]